MHIHTYIYYGFPVPDSVYDVYMKKNNIKNVDDDNTHACSSEYTYGVGILIDSWFDWNNDEDAGILDVNDFHSKITDAKLLYEQIEPKLEQIKEIYEEWFETVRIPYIRKNYVFEEEHMENFIKEQKCKLSPEVRIFCDYS